MKWVVLSDLGSMHGGGNSQFLLVGEKQCVVPSKSYFAWLTHSEESSETNLFYLNKDLEFVNLGVCVNLSQVDEINTLMKYNGTLGLDARGIVELVIERKLNIPNGNE